ncbi:MAG: hypothetical protein HYS34_09520 [Acidobacteria bacterium]|nr:hypothetical protein [Acidobacteriota bacterium]
MLFYICRSCYRGQRYCSDPCRRTTRREQRRIANRRHQQSDDGRLDHRDRQRAYRQRRRARVTDQGSAPASYSGSIAPQPDPTGRNARRLARRRVCCIVCGRRGRLIEMFKRRE